MTLLSFHDLMRSGTKRRGKVNHPLSFSLIQERHFSWFLSVVFSLPHTHHMPEVTLLTRIFWSSAEDFSGQKGETALEKREQRNSCCSSSFCMDFHKNSTHYVLFYFGGILKIIRDYMQSIFFLVQSKHQICRPVDYTLNKSTETL